MNSIVLVFFKYIEVLPRQWSPSGVQTIFLEIHQEISPRCDMDDRLVFSYLYVSGFAVFQVVPGFNKDGVPKATGISNPCWLYLMERQGTRNPTIVIPNESAPFFYSLTFVSYIREAGNEKTARRSSRVAICHTFREREAG